MTAKPGNTNALKGGRHSRYALTTGGMPKRWFWIRNQVYARRRVLEKLVREKYGEISEPHARAIHGATVWYQAGLKLRSLQDDVLKGGKSNPMDLASLAEREAACFDRSHKYASELGIDETNGSAAAVYATLPSDDDSNVDAMPDDNRKIGLGTTGHSKPLDALNVQDGSNVETNTQNATGGHSEALAGNDATVPEPRPDE